ncbi:hypothetical protein F66182_6337 [Fusarium sp. NRRL 66182]|nr:hypothetical protein F66182_6337 [Fusarium sp. NRRL 66182]
MVQSLSLGCVALASLLFSTPALAQSKAAALQSCLDGAGVANIIKTDETWAEETLGFQKRLSFDPATIAFPENRDQIAKSLECARKANVKATALGAAHSFQGLGFGKAGNLVISMGAFDSATYDPATTHLTFGGGAHVGPTQKYLWDTAGRHFPHVRGAHVGLTGSSLGCGYGSTSRHLGTPMDNIVAIEYMLANGTVVTATEGSDLLWAGKGAANSYGIVLSMTTKTFEPEYPTAVNFTLSLGQLDAQGAAEALIAVQDFALGPDNSDKLALRFNTASAPTWSANGYFYGNPSTFDQVVKPLLDDLKKINPNTTIAKTELDFWSMEVQVGGQGMNQPNGGQLGGRAFYTQALTTTTDNPLTVEQARILFAGTTLAFNHTALRRGGFIDLWGGISRDISDEETGHPHGKNLWLIRWEANAADVNNWPADGTRYLKSLIQPFEKALAKSAPLRGFVNYADTELSNKDQISRQYGKNYARLQQIKAAVDPKGLFTNNDILSITLPKKSKRV